MTQNTVKNFFTLFTLSSYEGTAFISRDKDIAMSKGKLNRGDLLLTTRGSVGHVALFDNTVKYENIRINSGMVILRSTNKTNSSSFLFFLFNSPKVTTQIKKTAFGSAQPQLTVKEIKRFWLAKPPLPEQQKIASFLSAVDGKIEQLGKKKALLGQYKKGMMQKLFSQELRFAAQGSANIAGAGATKNSEGNSFPDWEEKRLEEFKELVHGDGNWILSQDISKDGQFDIVQLGNIGLGKFVEKPMKKLSTDKFAELRGTRILKGDLLINRMVDSSLYCCLLEKDGDFVTSVDVCWLRKNLFLDNYFLMSLLLYTPNQRKLLNLSSGSGRVRISKKNLFGKFVFGLPCRQEQQKIANFLSSIDKKIDLVSTELDHAKTFKKGLLQQMFI